MKKYLLALMLFATAHVNAQKMHITDTTNVWYTMGTDSSGSVFWADYYYIIGTFSFGSHTYGSLQSSASPISGGVLLIREDTIAGMVYLLNSTPTPIETILYNYNLHLGDTIHYSYYRTGIPSPYLDTSIVDSVIGIDSTLINGLYYKVFSLLEIDTFHSHVVGWDPYLTYIEGIGSVFSPVNVQYGAMYDRDTVFLKCFTNNGLASAPVIKVPFTFPVAGHIDTFINSCATLGIPFDKLAVTEVYVVPNPIDKNAQIVFSQNISSGKVVVCNSVGQVVINATFQNKDVVTIGDKIKMPGLYFYEVMDNANGGVYRGKFVKE